ncbi:MAG TPA: SWIB/MDM2 domain-containing protein [Vicinamibacterales bacterium]|nr:SWIB/MDM2 domain-containing protein [Vicinamibacterales bacterium]
MAKKSAKSAKGAKKKAAKSVKRAAPAKKSAAKKTKGARKSPGRGRANAAFMAPVSPDSALAAVVGDKPMPRTEITKRLWAYIKKNGLQDSKNRRMINADASLKPVFGGKSTVNMFEMTKLVSKHVK